VELEFARSGGLQKVTSAEPEASIESEAIGDRGAETLVADLHLRIYWSPFNRLFQTLREVKKDRGGLPLRVTRGGTF
jgi:hypothetical protein